MGWLRATGLVAPSSGGYVHTTRGHQLVVKLESQSHHAFALWDQLPEVLEQTPAPGYDPEPLTAAAVNVAYEQYHRDFQSRYENMSMHTSQLGQTVYESKRDWWIVAIIWLGAAMIVFAGFDQFSSHAPFWVRAGMMAVFFAVAGFMLWLLYGCHYSFADEQLLIACGPIRYRVPLAEINAVRPSRSPLSSPACSLDRLLITWRNGKRKILVSPEAKLDFLRELERRCPQLRLEGERLVS